MKKTLTSPSITSIRCLSDYHRFCLFVQNKKVYTTNRVRSQNRWCNIKYHRKIERKGPDIGSKKRYLICITMSTGVRKLWAKNSEVVPFWKSRREPPGVPKCPSLQSVYEFGLVTNKKWKKLKDTKWCQY